MTIDEPKITGNAVLLCGFLSGMLRYAGNGPYEVASVSTADATLFLKHARNGNTYRVTVEQIGGVE